MIVPAASLGLLWGFFFFFCRFVEGSGRIRGLKGKNKVKCPLSLNMLQGSLRNFYGFGFVLWESDRAEGGRGNDKREG